MILVAIGANLAADGFGSPLETCEAAVSALTDEPGISVRAVSRWYESEPVPRSDQPWYVNGVLGLDTALGPSDLLAVLHRVEAGFGRVRRTRNEARPLDLDILDHDGLVSAGDPAVGAPVLPHPRMTERAFVLLPLRDVLRASGEAWYHPVTRRDIDTLIGALPVAGPEIRPIR